MPTARQKKSETLEIRLPYAAKQAFMAHCRARGDTASEVLRACIDERLSPSPAPRRDSRLARLAAGALIATAVGAFAVPNLALASLARPTLQAQVERIDRDGDGAVSLAEFARLDADRDGKVTLDELTGRRP